MSAVLSDGSCREALKSSPLLMHKHPHRTSIQLLQSIAHPIRNDGAKVNTMSRPTRRFAIDLFCQSDSSLLFKYMLLWGMSAKHISSFRTDTGGAKIRHCMQLGTCQGASRGMCPGIKLF